MFREAVKTKGSLMILTAKPEKKIAKPEIIAVRKANKMPFFRFLSTEGYEITNLYESTKNYLALKGVFISYFRKSFVVSRDYLNNFKISFASLALIFLRAKSACTKTQSPFFIFPGIGEMLTRRRKEPIRTDANLFLKEMILAGEVRHILNLTHDLQLTTYNYR